MKVLNLVADRGALIRQSQCLNVRLQAPTAGQLTSMHFKFLRLEARSQDWHRLPPHAPCGTSDPVHSRPLPCRLSQAASPQQSEFSKKPVATSPSVTAKVAGTVATASRTHRNSNV